MRRPDDFLTSMRGLFAAQMMGAADNVTQTISAALHYVNWWPFNGLVDPLVSAIQTASVYLANALFPGAPGAINYLTSGPEDLVYIAGNIYDTLAFFHAQRRYIQYQLIPAVQAQDQGLSWALYYNATNLAYQLYGQAINALYGAINAVYNYIYGSNAYILNYVSTNISMVLFYARSLYDSAIQQLVSVMVQLEARMDAEYHSALDYTTRVRDDLTNALNLAKLELAAAIAALGLWLTTTYIPGAFAAYTELTIAQIAAGMDVLWPFAARSIDATALKLATSLPLVAARAADVPPEPIPGVGGMAEALASSVGFLAAVADSAVAPMHVNLHKFGEDTHELGGIIGTVLLGGLVVAAVTAPEATATVVADAVANPLNDVLHGALSLIGLGG